MTELNFGESVSCWLGKVVNIKDPHESGRVQVRIYGRHDDISNIPDESLPWALVIQPVTSAAQGRLGSAPVGLTKNSQVFGFWLDSDHQYPLIMGTIGKSQLCHIHNISYNTLRDIESYRTWKHVTLPDRPQFEFDPFA